MTVGELIAALTDFDMDREVEIETKGGYVGLVRVTISVGDPRLHPDEILYDEADAREAFESEDG